MTCIDAQDDIRRPCDNVYRFHQTGVRHSFAETCAGNQQDSRSFFRWQRVSL